MLFLYDAIELNNCATAKLSHYDRQSYDFFDYTDWRMITPIVM